MFPIRHFADEKTLVAELGQDLLQVLAGAGYHPLAVMLSGGATPKLLFQWLASHPRNSPHGVRVLYTDDRLVPVTSLDSNHGNAMAMLRALHIAERQVMRIHAELGPEGAAARYQQELQEFLASGGHIPLGFLGLGSDGHTCSLFDAAAARRDDCLAFAVPLHQGFPRVTVTRALLARVERLVFLVTGKAKADILQRLQQQPESLPAGIAVAGHPRVEVWTDLPPAALA